jgi:hypothetical protein
MEAEGNSGNQEPADMSVANATARMEAATDEMEADRVRKEEAIARAQAERKVTLQYGKP